MLSCTGSGLRGPTWAASPPRAWEKLFPETSPLGFLPGPLHEKSCGDTVPDPGHTSEPPRILVTPQKGGVTSPTLPEPRGQPPHPGLEDDGKQALLGIAKVVGI